jgi:hypothetical protein
MQIQHTENQHKTKAHMQTASILERNQQVPTPADPRAPQEFLLRDKH